MNLPQDLQDIDWHVWHKRERTPLLIYLFFYLPALYAKDRIPTFLERNGSFNGVIVVDKEDLRKTRAAQWEICDKDPSFFYTFMQEMYALHLSHTDKWRRFLSTDMTSLSDEELFELYDSYIEDMKVLSPALYTPLVMEPLLTREVENILQKTFGESWKDHEQTVMTPIRPTTPVEAELSLLQIAVKSKKDEPIEEDLKKHIEYFGFLKRKGMFMEFFDEQYYKNEIKKRENAESAYKKLSDEIEERRKAFESVLEKIGHGTRDAEMLRVTNEAIYFRSWRSERYIQSAYYLQPLFMEMAKRFKLNNATDLLFVLPEEMRESDIAHLQHLVDERRQGYILITRGEKGYYISGGPDAAQLASQMSFGEGDTKTIKGNPAFTGIEEGVVTLVQKALELKDLPPPEILVTHATTPDMVPYLSSVKAIVTEEGGILSHAAVISREMKIPCVIGTGNVTKQLQNGDRVRVDAEKGIVTKL